MRASKLRHYDGEAAGLRTGNSPRHQVQAESTIVQFSYPVSERALSRREMLSAGEADHSPPPTAVGYNRLELYLCYPVRLYCMVLNKLNTWTTFTFSSQFYYFHWWKHHFITCAYGVNINTHKAVRPIKNKLSSQWSDNYLEEMPIIWIPETSSNCHTDS
jgi:hypothetical protein